MQCSVYLQHLPSAHQVPPRAQTHERMHAPPRAGRTGPGHALPVALAGAGVMNDEAGGLGDGGALLAVLLRWTRECASTSTSTKYGSSRKANGCPPGLEGIPHAARPATSSTHVVTDKRQR